MRTSRKASVLLVAGILLSAPAAWSADGGSGGTVINVPVDSNQELLFHSRAGECRDCFEAGVKLRTAIGPTGCGASGTISVPAHVAGSAVYATLFWVTLDNALPPATELFNSVPVTRVANGPVTGDPCWLTAFAFSWRADVLPLLVAGVNTLDCFPDNGVLGGAPNTEGATLVIVYNTTTIDKEIFVYGGNDLLDGNVAGGATTVTLAFPPIAPVGVGADLTFIVGDGQHVYNDEAYWNGAALDFGNAFQGLDPGPGTTAGGGGYWDTLKFGVGIAAANSAAIDISAYPGSFDCLNWVATVLCTKRGGCVVPIENSTWGNIKSLFRDSQ
jgi:hypothetical protein